VLHLTSFKVAHGRHSQQYLGQQEYLVHGHLLEASCLWCSCRGRLQEQLPQQQQQASGLACSVYNINFVFHLPSTKQF
jgi:hypothetical protein